MEYDIPQHDNLHLEREETKRNMSNRDSYVSLHLKPDQWSLCILCTVVMVSF